MQVIGRIAGFGEAGISGARLLARPRRANPTTVPTANAEAADVRVPL